MTYAGANLANLGLVQGEIDRTVTARTASGTALAAHVTAQQAAKSAIRQKNADRAAVVSLVRALVGRLQASAEVDDTATSRRGPRWASPCRTPRPVDAHADRPAHHTADPDGRVEKRRRSSFPARPAGMRRERALLQLRFGSACRARGAEQLGDARLLHYELGVERLRVAQLMEQMDEQGVVHA